MPKVFWDSSQICPRNSPFPRSKAARFQGLWKLSFFLFGAILLFPGWRLLFTRSVHSLELVFTKLCVGFPPSASKSFSIVFLWTTTCPFPPLMMLFFSDLLLLWTLAYSRLNFSLLPAWPFFILLTSCFQILPAFPPSLSILLLSFPWHCISPS